MIGADFGKFGQEFLAGAKVLTRRKAKVPARRFSGSAEEICRDILTHLTHGPIIRVSLGHLNYFWTRDLGTVTGALMRLGYRDQLLGTYRWALRRFREAGRVTTSIAISGQAFDTPTYGADSLPWLIRSLVEIGDKGTVEEFSDFLRHAIKDYIHHVVEVDAKRVRLDRQYSEIRDAIVYHSSTYANTMLLSLVRDLETLNLCPPELKGINDEKLFVRNFWNGKAFDAELNNHALSAEANLFPFWLNVVHEPPLLETTLNTLQAHGLNVPLPLHYTDTPEQFQEWQRNRLLNPGYQGATIWTWLGAIYLQLLKRAQRREYPAEQRRFGAMIEQFGTFPEVLQADGSWYRSRFYTGDEGMVWAALYLDLEH
jgi:hypothetical protein